MARVTFSQEDINRSKLVAPGWYPLKVTKFQEDQAGTDGSALYVYEVKINAGPFKDVPMRYQISEKAIGMGVDFVEACGFPVQAGVPLELEKCVGKDIEGFVQRGEYNGRPQNNLVQFRKPKGIEAKA